MPPGVGTIVGHRVKRIVPTDWRAHSSLSCNLSLKISSRFVRVIVRIAIGYIVRATLSCY